MGLCARPAFHGPLPARHAAAFPVEIVVVVQDRAPRDGRGKNGCERQREIARVGVDVDHEEEVDALLREVVDEPRAHRIAAQLDPPLPLSVMRPAPAVVWEERIEKTQKFFSEKNCLVFLNRSDEFFVITNGLGLDEHIEIQKKLAENKTGYLQSHYA